MSPRPAPDSRGERRLFLQRALLFSLIGLGLYAALYVWSESLVRRHALRNQFRAVQAAPEVEYEYVILGASHSEVLAYGDLNEHLETAVGGRVLNLSVAGAGVTLNRLLLEYFFLRHETGTVVYVLDSFAFYSAAWNEDRLADTELLLRTPWDPTLAWLLLREPASRSLGLGYATGFPKMNNPARFEPDSFPGEGSRFDRAYRPVPQIDRQRIEFLYPSGADLSSAATIRYLADLEGLIGRVRSQGARFLVVRPPLPTRIRNMIPGEDEFDAALADLLDRLGVPLHDFSAVNNDESLFYDPDHLNREGALRFIQERLGPALMRTG